MQHSNYRVSTTRTEPTRKAMQTRLTSEHAAALACDFWDKYPALVYKRDFLKFTDWFTMPTASNRLPEPVCRTLVRGWLAHVLLSENVSPTASNLCRVMKWVKGGRNA